MPDPETTTAATQLENALVVSTPDGELHEKSEEYVQNIVDILGRFDLVIQAIDFRLQTRGSLPDDDARFHHLLQSTRNAIEEQLKNIHDFEQSYHDGKVNVVGEVPGSVGAPGFWGGLVPFYGSGRSLVNDYENKRYGWATFDAVLFASDFVLVRDFFEAFAKGAVNLGKYSFKWSATRARLGTSRTLFGIELEPYAAKGQEIHHWLFHQNQGIGKMLPDWLKNQGYNYLRIPEKPPGGFSPSEWHQALHGKGPVDLGLLRRMWYSSPRWPKLVVVSYGGRATEYALDGEQ
jgi:hypothetical protein